MDNCGPHGSDVNDSRGQVTIFSLLPNCTSIHQLMDLEVISKRKTIYCRNLLAELIGDIENQDARREEHKKKSADMKIIAEGYDPHMHDVTRVCEKSWDDVTCKSIAQYLRKSGILPVSGDTNLLQCFGKVEETKVTGVVLSDIPSMFRG